MSLNNLMIYRGHSTLTLLQSFQSAKIQIQTLESPTESSSVQQHWPVE